MGVDYNCSKGTKEVKNMKLIIKELLRDSDELVEQWKYEFDTVEECTKCITKIDKEFSKITVHFVYIIKE